MYNSPDIPLMYGNSTADVAGHKGASMMPSVTLSLEGPVSVGAHLTPANARALADQLIAAADYAEGKA